MRFLELSDFVRKVESNTLLAGKVTRVDTEKMVMDVWIGEGFDIVVKEVPIKMEYCSGVVNSVMVAVPRVGDDVYVMNRNGKAEHVGYVNSYVKESEYEVESVWSRCKRDGVVGGEGGVVERGFRVADLREGDIGIFVHEGDRIVDFVLKRDGRIVVGFGAGMVVYNQDEGSERKLVNYMKSSDFSGGSVEWGVPVVKGVDGMERKVHGDFAFKVKGSDVEMCIGYVDGGGGLPAMDREGKIVRGKVKIGDCEILVSKDGNIEIKTKGNIMIRGNDVRMEIGRGNMYADNVDMNVKKEVVCKVDKSVKVETGQLEVECKGDVNVKGGNVKIEGSNVEVEGQRIKLGGEKGFVLEDVLGYLVGHTHVDSQGKTTTPSAQLAPIIGMKSVIVKGM